MKSLTSLCFGLTALLLAPLALPAQEKLQENLYFPLKVGTEWFYRAGDKEVHLQVDRLETVGKIPCAVLLTKREGLPISEHVTVKPDGVYRVKALRFEVDPPLCFLKRPKKGKMENSWKGVANISGENFTATFRQEAGTVKVPAGEFGVLIVRCEVERKQGEKLEIISYYAPEKGMVKQVQKLGAKEIVMELEKMREGK